MNPRTATQEGRVPMSHLPTVPSQGAQSPSHQMRFNNQGDLRSLVASLSRVEERNHAQPKRGGNTGEDQGIPEQGRLFGTTSGLGYTGTPWPAAGWEWVAALSHWGQLLNKSQRDHGTSGPFGGSWDCHLRFGGIFKKEIKCCLICLRKQKKRILDGVGNN